MTGPTRRRVTISDGLSLVAATGVGLAAVRIVTSSEFHTGAPLERLILTEHSASLFVLVLNITLLGLHFRTPRPAWHVLFRRSGFIASAAVCVTLMTRCVTFAGDLLCYRSPDSLDFENTSDLFFHQFDGGLDCVAVTFATSVLCAWVVTGLAGCRQADAGWLDRAGRAAGWYWIGSAVAFKSFEWGMQYRRDGWPWW